MTLDKPLSVSEFVTIVKTHLQTAVGQVAVQGEISGYRIAKDKLVFFELKDKKSRVLCFMMKYQLQTAIEDGMEVKVTGYPSLFQNAGRFHIRVQQVEPVGEGALQRAFELLKKKLLNEGLFAEERKRPLPRFPSKIGLVTSPDAAAYTDVQRILDNRWGGLDIVLTPVGVQGQVATSQIVGAIQYQNQVVKPSVIILTRGGGSLEDLQAFNSEEVARAVFSSQIPIVSGIGHERDITIADLVADVRASTPSNSAERVVPDRREILFEVNTLIKRSEDILQDQLRDHHEQINESVRRIEHVFRDRIQRFRELRNSFQKHFWLYRQKLDYYNKDIIQQSDRLTANLQTNIKQSFDKLTHLRNLLKSLNPERVLARGYTMTTSSNGKIIRSSDDVAINDNITTKLAHGQLDSKITKKK
ncbi:exodeoxyribonuclease VII large subunit [Patescibacteria group bacterium]|nr:exodeoxyribonuclease VII large subunit [Patescibacteria group bacterium]MBU1891033.1 exodeoxyribonuclease VII large subunit [Patescibacteria group bacterium]